MVVFGILGFGLPRLGYDLTWFEYLGSARDLVAAGLIAFGVALVIYAWRKRAPDR
jgi:hypothetical protein